MRVNENSYSQTCIFFLASWYSFKKNVQENPSKLKCKSLDTTKLTTIFQPIHLGRFRSDESRLNQSAHLQIRTKLRPTDSAPDRSE